MCVKEREREGKSPSVEEEGERLGIRFVSKEGERERNDKEGVQKTWGRCQRSGP